MGYIIWFHIAYTLITMKENFQYRIWFTENYVEYQKFEPIWPYFLYMGVRYFFGVSAGASACFCILNNESSRPKSFLGRWDQFEFVNQFSYIRVKMSFWVKKSVFVGCNDRVRRMVNVTSLNFVVHLYDARDSYLCSKCKKWL